MSERAKIFAILALSLVGLVVGFLAWYPLLRIVAGYYLGDDR